MAVALRNKENLFSPNDSPIQSPEITRRKRVAPRTTTKEKPLLQRVLSDVGNVQHDSEIFSPTRVSPSKKRPHEVEENPPALALYYQKKYCVECAKMNHYIMSNSITIKEKRLVSNNYGKSIGSKEAVKLARTAKTVISSVDGKVTRLTITPETTDKEIKTLILGRQKSLRAPAFLYENTFVVGFNEAVNEELFYGVVPEADAKKVKN